MSIKYFVGYIDGDDKYSACTIPFTTEEDFVQRVLWKHDDLFATGYPLFDYLYSTIEDNRECLTDEWYQECYSDADYYDFNVYKIAMELIFPDSYESTRRYRIIDGPEYITLD